MSKKRQSNISVRCSTCNALHQVKQFRLDRIKGNAWFCSLACRWSKDQRLKRFWDRVRKTDSCWLWQGRFGHRGHGQLGFNGKQTSAHRVSWEITYGPIPAGFQVLHNCPIKDNPACVNPSHLWLGTCSENVKDAWQKQQCHGQRGTANPAAKLNEDQIKAIRELKHQMTNQKIACLYGVSKSTISYIIQGKHWKHI